MKRIVGITAVFCMLAMNLSAGRYAGEDSDKGGVKFVVQNQDGSLFEYRVNDDGVSVTLSAGVANGATKLVIPSSVEESGSLFLVTGIDDFAFSNYGCNDYCAMKGVTHLVISEGIMSIGENAFDKSPDLEIADLPSSLKSIPYSLFYDCARLREVRIPVDSRISDIGSFAFAGCVALESFVIPSEVSQIGEGPWRGCTSLESLSIQEGNYNFITDDGVLYSGWQGDLIQYPAGKKDQSYRIRYGTEAIGNSAFYGNPYIESVYAPASVDSISHIAFFDCKSLETVTFSDVISYIGNKAFAQCPNLKEISLYGPTRYTDRPGYSYNTFNDATIVKKHDAAPEIKLPKAKGGILQAAMEHVAGFDGFETGMIDKNEDYGFPDFFGTGKWAVYGNAGPKKDVMNVLATIPAKLLALEDVDDKGRITRLYLDKSDKNNPRLLYFFGGIGGNDLVVFFFENGNLMQIEKMIKEKGGE